MIQSVQFNARVARIGHELFERAAAAVPRWWHKQWWLEGMTRIVEIDEDLKRSAFQFVDCLPALRTDEALARHLHEYFDDPGVPLPGLARSLLRSIANGSPLQGSVARAARFGATQMAGRFIAGFDQASLLATVNRLRDQGLAFTLDVLGEATTSYARARRYTQTYVELLDAVAAQAQRWPGHPLLDSDRYGPIPRVNLSIKLTGMDPHFDAIDPERVKREVGEQLRPLLRKAREAGAFVNVDMEQFRYCDLTLRLFIDFMNEPEFRDWPDVGIVVQAYLRDSENDLRTLLEWGRKRGTRFAIRLVKGAYWDAETAAAVRARSEPPVWTAKWQSDVQYEKLARIMLTHCDVIRPAFASHNVRSLAFVMALAEEFGVPANEYEIQMLYGMGDPLKAAVAGMGRYARIYLPYGDLLTGMGYLIRRLLENTSNDSFLKQGFNRRETHARLLADPNLIRPPSAPLPVPEYVNTDREEPMSAFVNASTINFGQAVNQQRMRDGIDRVRHEAGRRWPIVIEDQSIETDEWFESPNPADLKEIVGAVARAATTHADRAVAAATRAFERWSQTAPLERADRVNLLADLMEADRFQLAASMVLECGKPWREADGDLVEAVDFCRFYAEEMRLLASRPRRRDTPGESNVLTYAPKGVCAVIAPSNFPLAMLAGMTSAALVAGNTVVIKPGTSASITAARFMRLVMEAEIPAGVASFLPGQGPTVGSYLAQHPGVQTVAFTGSTRVGVQVHQAAMTGEGDLPFIRQVIMQMGGKNAIIVDDDADVDGAVQAVIESAFAYAGQRCSSCSRVIVLPSVAEDFLSRLRDAAASLVIGPPEEPSTQVGPVMDRNTFDRARELAEVGKKESEVLVEVAIPERCRGGLYVSPIVLDKVPQEARVLREEIGGPVLAVQRAQDFDDALRLANDSRYALTGGLYSRSPANIDKARRLFQVGNLYINRKVTGAQVDVQPFGGFKLSGQGIKIGARDYLLQFLNGRCIAENTLRSGFVADESEAEPLSASVESRR